MVRVRVRVKVRVKVKVRARVRVRIRVRIRAGQETLPWFQAEQREHRQLLRFVKLNTGNKYNMFDVFVLVKK